MLLALTLALAWRERGSIVASDWLPYAVVAGFLLLIVVLFGGGRRPSHLTLAAFTGLSGLAAWTALSSSWSPVPSLARDEALLITLYAFALITPVLTLRTRGSRFLALSLFVLGFGIAAAATGAALAFGDAPGEWFREGRLYFPVTYVNAEAAFALVGVWPALALAAHRDAGPAVRALGLATAVAALGVWLLTQSAGGGVALLASAVVVLAVATDRLRLLVPTAVAAGLAALAAPVLTEPYRAAGGGLEPAVRDAGRALLLVMLAAALVGLAYAFADRRITVAPKVHRALGRAAVALLLLGVVAGAVAFGVIEGDPRAAARERWEQFSQDPEVDAAGTHFASFGSERPDFWRVGLTTFREHPVAGVGARGFGTVYRQEGRSDENPERAHSLPIDALAETGLVGIGLLLLALASLLAIAFRRRRTPWGLAALGAGTYWVVHASGDWLWTVPSVGLTFFLVLGVAASDDARPAGHALGRRVTAAGAVAIAALLLAGFAPPWLSARLSEHALRTRDDGGLRLARRLDPLSVTPYLAESALAASPGAAIPPLQRALELEPRSAPLRLLLANAYEDAGQVDAARRELAAALRLHPRSNWARGQLERLEAG